MDKRSILKGKLTARLCSVVVFLLVCGLFFPLAGCDNTPEPQTTAAEGTNTRTLNWQLYGTWISADGTTHEPAAGSITGTAQLGETGEDRMELSITFTEGCNYMYTNPITYISQSRKYLKVPYCVSPHYAYNKTKNDSVFSYIGISIDKEFVIFHWQDKDNLYLVASTDPDADPKDILSYFSVYVNTYHPDT